MTADDEQIGKNLARLRGDFSQKELADRMRTRGFRWSQATVWSVEKGERPLRLTEAEAVTEILSLLSVYSITAPEGHAEFRRTHSRLAEAQNDLDDKAATVLRLQRQLAEELDNFPVDELSESDTNGLEWDLGLAPIETMRDRQTDMLLTLRATEAQLGHFGRHMLSSLEAIRVEVGTDIKLNKPE